MSHTDFQVPGLQRTQNGTSRWIVSTAWAYSSRWNNRRLENHFHGIWNIVLQDLTADLAPQVFVVAQYQIDSVNKAPAAPDNSTDTAARRGATELTPDFSVVMTHIVPRPRTIGSLGHHPFASWNKFMITAFIVPMFAELKRSPSRRCASFDVFYNELSGLFDEAVRDLEKQVENAFAMQSEEVDHIILVACVGEWWCWKLAARDRYLTDTDEGSMDFLGGLFQSENAGSPKGPRKQPQRDSKTAESRQKCVDHPDQPDPPSDKLPYRPSGKGKETKRSDHPIHYTDLGEQEEQVEQDVEDAFPPEDDWSHYIRLGSAASNQRLFLIHRFLGTQFERMPLLSKLWSPKQDDHDGLLVSDNEEDRYSDFEDDEGDGGYRDEDEGMQNDSVLGFNFSDDDLLEGMYAEENEGHQDGNDEDEGMEEDSLVPNYNGRDFLEGMY